MKTYIITIFSILLISFCQLNNSIAQQVINFTSTTVVNPINNNAGQAVLYTYQVFKNADNSYGYNILANNVVYFKQEKFPGKTTGFTTEKIASIVAATIVAKIKSKRFAPSLSDQELIAQNLQ